MAETDEDETIMATKDNSPFTFVTKNGQKVPLIAAAMRQHKDVTCALVFSITAACWNCLAFGFAIGFTTSAVDWMVKEKITTEAGAAWWASIFNIGAMCGCLFGAAFSDRLGRKASIGALLFPMNLGWLLQASSSNFTVLMVGRVLTGIACGLVTTAVPPYVVELCTTPYRGFFGAWCQLFIVAGIVLSNFFALFLTSRELALLCLLAISLPASLMLLGLPESPRLLALRGRRQEAAMVLRWLRGVAEADDELQDMPTADKGAMWQWSDLKEPQNSHPLVLVILVCLGQQLTCINGVIFFAGQIFTAAGLEQHATAASTFLALIQLVMTLAATLLVEREGRQRLLLLSAGGVTLSLGALALQFAYSPGALSLLILSVYIASFSVGWGPLPFLLLSEITPVKIRGFCVAVALFVNWGTSFIITNQFQQLVAAFGAPALFGGFAIINCMVLSFVVRAIPETKGRSLEDMELYFLNKGGQKAAGSNKVNI